MVPAFTAMHENGGRLPTECIFAFAHQFSSDMYTGIYNVAEYTVWRSGVDQTPIYDWHKRHLQTLQWVAERPARVGLLDAMPTAEHGKLEELRPFRSPTSDHQAWAPKSLRTTQLAIRWVPVACAQHAPNIG